MEERSFAGTNDELAAVLVPHISTVEFVTYPESIKAPLDRKAILDVAPMWRDLRKLQKNLCFKKTSMEAALVIAHALLPVPLPALSEQSVMADWSARMALRIRAQGSAINKAIGKSATTPWLLELFPDDAPPVQKKPSGKRTTSKIADPSQHNSPSAATSSDTLNFFYGYDSELRKAWRCPGNQPAAK